MHTTRLTAFVLILMCIIPVSAQRRNARYQSYIKEYAPLAVEQMKLFCVFMKNNRHGVLL